MADLKCELLSATLDQFNTGIILLYGSGQIVHTNAIADDMLANSMVIGISGGYLRGKSKSTNTVIYDVLSSLVSQDVEDEKAPRAVEVCLQRASHRMNAMTGSFRRLQGLGHEQPVIALFMTKFEQVSRYNLTGVAQSYDLTRAETRTLEQIACGSAIADVRTGCVVSKNTVKTHLQKIFEKTGTSRQTELLRLVYASRAPLRSSVYAQ